MTSLVTPLCAICWADDTEEPNRAAWTEADLTEAIAWTATFVPAGTFTQQPGRYRICPLCTAWLPQARTAPLPAPVAELIDNLAGHIDDTRARRRFTAEMVGAFRHLGRQLRPVT